MKIIIKSFAKINPFLAVGDPLPNGYHPVRTILQTVDVHDTLTIETAEVDSFECVGAVLPVENTVTKALRLIREQYLVEPVRIHLEKRIPIEAGLGGGSSNAAALIRGAYQLMRKRLDDFGYDVATAVGMDVPFFLTGGTAKGENFGEQITNLTDAPARFGLIVKPSQGINTKEAYQALDQTHRVFKNFPDFNDHFWTQENLYNDFERISPCVCGEIAERLRVHGAESSLLSGSGSAVFGIFHDEKMRENAKRIIFSEFNANILEFSTLSAQESLQMEVIR